MRSKLFTRYILAACLFVFVSACNRSSRLFPTPNLNSVGWHEYSIKVNDKTRWFQVYIPKILPLNTGAVFVLHGSLQSMREIFAPNSGGTLGWVDVAEREGIILVAPNGTNPDTGNAKGDDQDWNDLRTDLDTKHSNAEDVEFIRELHDWIINNYSIDSKKVFITGISTGGIMMFRVIFELPGRFAAAASFNANLPNPTSIPGNYIIKTPIMLVNGVKDPFMKWDGGSDYDIGNMKSTLGTVDWWITTNNATTLHPIISILPDIYPKDGCQISRTFYPANGGGAPVMFYQIDGGGHTFPTSKYTLADEQFQETIFGPVCHDAEGAELAWQFLMNPNSP